MANRMVDFVETGGVENNSKDQDDKIKRNIKAGIAELSDKFLDNVRSGKIRIQDTKDLKDIASVYQAITANDSNDGDTPAVTPQVFNFYNNVAGGNDTAKLSDRGIVHGIEDMDSDEIEKLIASRDTDLDKINEEGWQI